MKKNCSDVWRLRPQTSFTSNWIVLIEKKVLMV